METGFVFWAHGHSLLGRRIVAVRQGFPQVMGAKPPPDGPRRPSLGAVASRPNGGCARRAGEAFGELRQLSASLGAYWIA
jgi:hypothetical protein